MTQFCIFASYGNDSIATIQWAKEHELEKVKVVYSDTGWSEEFWKDRVDKCEDWVKSLGYEPHRIISKGFENLIKERKMTPNHRFQFCSFELKIKPAMEWLEINDPDKNYVCMVGIRREESLRRKSWPEVLVNSPNHSGRILISPLVAYTKEDRDSLIKKAGFEVLNHRSQECFPCINSNRQDLRELLEYPNRIKKIKQIEEELGSTKDGRKKYFFMERQGAQTVDEVLEWAAADRGKYQKLDPNRQMLDEFFEDSISGCDSGFCEG